jgi:DNA-binding GntR family transcriptional regulator
MPSDRAPRLTPAISNSLVQIAYDAIRNSILDGGFAMGEHIVEVRVSDELGTSRAPVREALRRLQQEGLVVEHPRRGIFVREITAKDFIDIYNVRIAVECAAARLIGLHQPSLKPIEKTVAQMQQAAARKQVSKTVDLELSVHQQICDASGNDYLASVFRSLSGPVRMALGIDDAAYERLEDVANEHVPLLEALSSGDGERAARAVHKHIVASVGPVLKRLGGDEQDLLAESPLAGTSR